MSATSNRSSAQAPAAASTAQPARALTPAELAWVALLPCAIALLAAIVLLGPAVGNLLIRPTSDALWPTEWWASRGTPEPSELGGYALAVLAAALLTAGVLAGARRSPRLPPPRIRAFVLTSHLLLVASVAFAVLGQLRAIPANGPANEPRQDIFGVPALLAAAAVVTAALLGLRRRRVADWIAQRVRETRQRRILALTIAATVATSWLLEAVTTDRLVEDRGQMNWTTTEAFAVLDGRTPLVDYHTIYGNLILYPTALTMRLLGTTGFVYTAFMAALSVLTLLAVYAIFRRVVGSSLLALGLFAPFLAVGDVADHTMIYAAMWPMRYGGAYLMAWLTVRHVDRVRPRQTWILFFAGGFVALNLLDFGSAAVIATLAALLCARPPRTVRDALHLAGSALAGLLGAVALVSAFTYARAGALPDPALLMEWPRVFTTLGLLSLPMPAASLHLAVYATFVAALATAAVRLARSAPDVRLTSMLMWSGIFGLLAGSYYVGRSEDIKLVSLFSAWGFALVLLSVVTVRALAARGWRAPAIPELLVLFGLALAVCSIGGFPPPWGELSRLTTTSQLRYRAAAEQFVGEHTRRGEKVVILLPESYRIAYDLGLDDVSPYVITDEVVTLEQMQRVIDTAHREQVRRIFVPALHVFLLAEGQITPEHVQAFAEAGYPPRAEANHMLELSSEDPGPG